MKFHKRKFKLLCFSLSMSLLWAKTLFPINTYLVLIIITLLASMSVGSFIRTTKNDVITYFKGILPYLIVLCLFFFSVMLSDKMTSLILKDIRIIFIVLFISMWASTFREKNEDVYIAILFSIFILAFISSFLGIVNFILNNAISSATSGDNNYYAVFNIVGLMILSYYRVLTKTKINKALGFLFSSSFILSIILSGSRRAIIILGILFLSLLFKLILSKKWRKTLVYDYVFIISISSLCFFCVVFLPTRYKYLVADKLNVDYGVFKKSTNRLLKDYNTIFFNDTTQNRIDYFFSEEDLQKKYFLLSVFPELIIESSTTNFLTPVPIGKSNSEISPFATGIMVSKSSDTKEWFSKTLQDTISYTETFLPTVNIYKGEIYRFTSLVFISKDCTLSNISLKSWGNSIKGKIASLANLDIRDKWQRLSIDIQATNATFSKIVLYTSNEKKCNYDDIEGYVLFGTPSIQKIDGDSLKNVIEQKNFFLDYLIADHYLEIAKNEFVEGDYDSSFRTFRIAILFNPQITDQISNYSWSDLSEENIAKQFNMKSLGKKDVNKSISINYINKNRLMRQRVERWVEAVNYFNSYSNLNRLFGKGFDYHTYFGKKFWNDSERYDYPHNFLLSTLLYSGYLGVISILLFLIHSIITIRNMPICIREIWMTIAILILSMSFISSDNFFSSPMLNILFLVPLSLNKGT